MKQYSQQGQTLIEVLVTVLFIAIGVISLIRFQNYLAHTSSLTLQKGRASILAISKIESLKNFQVFSNTPGYTSYDSIVSGSSVTTNNTATYTMTWTVTSFTNPTYKNVDLTVSWPDRTGTTQTIRYITNIAGIDPQTATSIK